MRDILKPYEEYKFCPYTEIIPKHWNIDRLSLLFLENKDLNTTIEETNALQFRFGQIIKKQNLEIDETLKKTISKYTIVNPMDLVINGLNLNYDFVTQRVGFVNTRGVITSSYISLTPRQGVNSRYYSLLLKAYDARKIFNGMGSGIRLTLDYTELKKMELPVPTRDEQDKIVYYLDAKTAMLNKLINSKKKQVSLLKEQKQVIINNAVTKGINKNIKMKPSEVEGLGDIPYEWEVAPLKYFVRSNIETLKDSFDKEKQITYIDISTVGFGELKQEPVKYYFKDAPSRARRVIHEGDTIISTVRTYLKSMTYIDKSLDGYIASTGFAVLTPNDNVFPRLLNYVLSADNFVNRVRKNSIGVSYPAISETKLTALKIALPTNIDEQKKILEYIKLKTTSIDNAISKINKEIELISEYKTSLIYEVVTGKVDIRDIKVNSILEIVEEDSYEESEEYYELD